MLVVLKKKKRKLGVTIQFFRDKNAPKLRKNTSVLGNTVFKGAGVRQSAVRDAELQSGVPKLEFLLQPLDEFVSW